MAIYKVYQVSRHIEQIHVEAADEKTAAAIAAQHTVWAHKFEFEVELVPDDELDDIESEEVLKAKPDAQLPKPRVMTVGPVDVWFV